MIFAFCSGAILLAGIVSAGIDALMLVHAALIGRILAGIGGGTPLPSSSEGHFLMAKGVGTPPPRPFPTLDFSVIGPIWCHTKTKRFRVRTWGGGQALSGPLDKLLGWGQALMQNLLF